LYHKDEGSTKFLQRYFVNEQSATDSDILFVEVGGEWELTPPVDLPARLGKLYGARSAALEHRYYG
jgi:hypothetical protein